MPGEIVSAETAVLCCEGQAWELRAAESLAPLLMASETNSICSGSTNFSWTMAPPSLGFPSANNYGEGNCLSSSFVAWRGCRGVNSNYSKKGKEGGGGCVDESR